MPLIAGTGLQVYIALLSLFVGAAVSPLYEWTRPLKRKNKVLEIALDLFFMLAAAGIFLLFSHFALSGRLSFYSGLCFYLGIVFGVCILRKTERFFRLLLFKLNKLIFGEKDESENQAAPCPQQNKKSKHKKAKGIKRIFHQKLFK